MGLSVLELRSIPAEIQVKLCTARSSATRTLLTESMYQITMARCYRAVTHGPSRKVTGTRLVVPVNALLFRSEGLRAVAVDANHRTHLKPLTIGRDYGTTLEVLQGLDASDWIVLNPADSLEEGQEVRVKETAMTPAPGQARPAPGTAPGTKKQ